MDCERALCGLRQGLRGEAGGDGMGPHLAHAGHARRGELAAQIGRGDGISVGVKKSS